jgi:cardiolipin synthase
MTSRIFTVPNQLTFLRLGFLPFFIISIYYDRFGWALGILLAAAASDALDGLLARRLNQKTALGAYLDPIADKLLLSSSFLLLAFKGLMPWWLTILVLSRDVLILAVSAAVLIVAGYRRLPPTLYGKATTLSQIVLIVVALTLGVVEGDALALLRTIFIYLVAAFTVLSGLHYSVVIARRLSGSS